jgi:hypothetical protein
VNFFLAELGSKQLGLLRALLPTATRVGLLVNPNIPLTEPVARDVMAAAAGIGLKIDVVNASNSPEIEAAFGTLVQNRDDALLVGPDALLLSRRVQLATLATRYKGNASHADYNTKRVQQISPLLKPGRPIEPEKLTSGPFVAFLGAKPQAAGFVLSPDEADHLRSFLGERRYIVGYLRGEMVNELPETAYPEHIIDVNGLELNELENLPHLYDVLRQRVWPQRKSKSGGLKERWWRYGFYPKLLVSIRAKQADFIITARTSNTFGFAICRPDGIVNDKVICFGSNRFSSLALLQSRIHEIWARLLSATRTTDLQYTPSDCFETFPFPTQAHLEIIETAGIDYHDHRAALMIDRNEGMTKTYNRFHDRTESAEDIVRLRELHAAMDRAVLEAYASGASTEAEARAWHDLAERAEPIFLDETNEDDHTYQGRLFWPSVFRDEVLARLLALNAERHAEEVRLGVAPGMKKKPRSDDDDQPEDE